MSEHPPRLDLCCSLPTDAQAVHTDLFDLQPVADGVYAAIAAPQYNLPTPGAGVGGVAFIEQQVEALPAEIAQLQNDILRTSSREEKARLETHLEPAEAFLEETTVAEQLAPKYEQGMSKYPLGQYRDRIGPTIEIVYHKVVQTP